MNRPLAVNVPLYAIRHQAIGGTEFAVYALLKALAANPCRLTVTFGRDADLSPEIVRALRGMPTVRLARTGGLPGPKNVRFAEEALFALRPTDDDWLLFPNYFVPPIRRGRRRCAVVLHDIQYRIFPHYHSSKRRAWLDFYLPRMFRAVDRVILISQSEAALVREQFGAAAAAKCAVVPNAIDWARFEPSGAPLSEAVEARLRRRYILSVCHPFPHKNVETLLRAFVPLADAEPDLFLHLIGASSERNTALVRSVIPERLLDRVELLGFVGDEALGAYYRHAAVFALPSLYEGFGLPAAEAMGFGVPTVVSRAFALPEVTFDAADYVDEPRDAEAWQRQLRAALHAPRLATGLVDRVRQAYDPAAVGARLLSALT